jgi:hypothetical protein
MKEEGRGKKEEGRRMSIFSNYVLRTRYANIPLASLKEAGLPVETGTGAQTKLLSFSNR